MFHKSLSYISLPKTALTFVKNKVALLLIKVVSGNTKKLFKFSINQWILKVALKGLRYSSSIRNAITKILAISIK